MSLKPREIWNKGCSLNEAWLEFGDKEKAAVYRSMGEIGNLKPIDWENNESNKLNEFALGIVDFLSRPTRQAGLATQLQNDLIALLLSEKLYAYGFPIWPSEARIPRRIQSEFWDNAEINWEKGTANDAQYQFQRIRIVDPNEYPELDLKPDIGRTTYKEYIYAACKDLHKANSGFFKLTNKEKIQKIRDLIKANNPKIDVFGPNMGDDAIRKHINAYRDEYAS